MNQKIKQLAEQAGFKKAGTLFETEVPEYAMLLEKFAELIVKECAEQIELMRKRVEEYGPPPGYDSDTFRLAYNDSIDTIKEHFGVEE